MISKKPQKAIHIDNHHLELGDINEIADFNEYSGKKKMTGVYLNFSRAVSKTITLSITDGTKKIKIWDKENDTGVDYAESFMQIDVQDGWVPQLEVTGITGAACIVNGYVILKSN